MRASKRIPRQSFFAPLRSLPRVPPQGRWDEEWIGDEDPVDALFTPILLPPDHPASRHFGIGQNDAHILRLAVEPTRVVLTINHYDIERMAAVLDEGTRTVRRSFPVTFSFEGVSEAQVVRAVEQDRFQKIRHSATDLTKRVLDVSTLDCLFFEPGRERYLLTLHGGKPFNRTTKRFQGSYSNAFYVAIECAELRVDERYMKGWNRYFSGRYGDVIEEWDEMWPVPRWTVPDFQAWLEDRFPSLDIP